MYLMIYHPTLPWQNFNLNYLIFSKILNTNMDSQEPIALSIFYDCSTNSIFRIDFGLVSNSFCQLKSNAISL